ncbi:MAG: type III-A CRISPR-associated RAMP protein Csm5, partial [Thermoanaerobacteraceae bacterium]|nr:type III-A CRISPR-associated RAMP protein Csm5 [Thermoanaerobacteraceae bacterium]
LKVKLKTLSPVNIGNGEIISQFCDYVYDSGVVYYLNHDLIVNELSKRPGSEKLIDEFVAVVRTQAGGSIQNRLRLKGFFENMGLDFKNFASKKIPVEGEIKEQIQLHIKTGSKPYVPGSSLKGAIRTAIISYFFTENSERNIKNSKEYIGQDIFGRYNEDILKFLQVSDTTPFGEEDLGIAKFFRYNLETDKMGIPVIKEIIPTKRASTFTIGSKAKEGKIDTRFKFLEEGKEKSLFEIMNAYSRKNVENELKELKRSNNSELQDAKEFYAMLLDAVSTADSTKEAYLRIGSGKTYYDNTIARKLSKDFLEKIITNNFKKADANFFPQTRTLVLYKGQKQAPGWVKLEKV